MLTDIFADRYASVPMWDQVNPQDERFLVQGFRIVSEQVFPYWYDGKESPWAKEHWTSIHDKLSMELGVTELSPKFYSSQSDWGGKSTTQSRAWTMDYVCKNFVLAKFNGVIPPDQFLKNRISFFELALREREEEINAANKKLLQEISKAELKEKFKGGSGIRLPGSRVDGLVAGNKKYNQEFKDSVDEFNERMRRAGYNLNYHNGFIQISDDEVIEHQIEKPFWNMVSAPLWENVDIDMKEAIDLRDSGGRDPVWYAARALESTIKIISDEKGWTHGGEKGAHNYIDNLASTRNGHFIEVWEKDALKVFFTSVRNPFGHGPGSDKMPKLTPQQTDWAIANCMNWVKTLIKRM